MKYYPEPDIHIRDKVKVLLELTNDTTTKELKKNRGIDTSNLNAKKDFIASKAKVDKPDKLKNVLGGLNKLKTKVDVQDVDELKTVPNYLRKLSDSVDKKVVKMTKNEKLNSKAESSKDKTFDSATLIYVEQNNRC